MTHPHRVESVYQKVIDTVTNLQPTGENVFRDRTTNVPEDKLPCICAFMGDDENLATYSHNKMDWQLEVFLDAKVKIEDDTPLTQALLIIRNAINAALEADYTLGLSYVIGIVEQSVPAPTLSHEGDQPIAVQRYAYKIQYRRTRADSGAS